METTLAAAEWEATMINPRVDMETPATTAIATNLQADTEAPTTATATATSPQADMETPTRIAAATNLREAMEAPAAMTIAAVTNPQVAMEEATTPQEVRAVATEMITRALVARVEAWEVARPAGIQGDNLGEGWSRSSSRRESRLLRDTLRRRGGRYYLLL